MAVLGVLVLPTGAELAIEIVRLSRDVPWSACVLLTGSQALQLLTAGKGTYTLKVQDKVAACKLLRRDLSISYGGTIELAGLEDFSSLN